MRGHPALPAPFVGETACPGSCWHLVGTNDRRREHLSWAFGSASAFMLMPGPYRFDYCSFVEGFEIEKCETSKFVFLLVVSPWNSI